MPVALDSFGPLDPAALQAAGVSGILRYLAPPNPQTTPKIATTAQLQEARAHGLDVTLNWEWFEQRPLGGFLAGQQDAILADSEADALGYPLSSAIYYSVDFGASWAQVSQYVRGIHSISRRPVGLYGGLHLIDSAFAEGLISYGWVTNAASWSGAVRWSDVANAARGNPHCHLLQHLHDGAVAVPGINPASFDANDILQADYGQWAAHPKGPFTMLNDAQQAELYNHVAELYGLIFGGVGQGPAHTQSMIHDIEGQNAQTQALVRALPKPPTADEVAAAVVAKLPAGSIDAPTLAKAVADELQHRLTS